MEARNLPRLSAILNHIRVPHVDQVEWFMSLVENGVEPGSGVLDWIPKIANSSGDHVLYNYNPHSRNYEKVAVQLVDETGYTVLDINIQETARFLRSGHCILDLLNYQQNCEQETT